MSGLDFVQPGHIHLATIRGVGQRVWKCQPGGDGLVAHDQARAERKSPRNANALTLSAGELVRVVAHLTNHTDATRCCRL